ncbi:MAG: alpha/beta hydrolase [Acidobacteria bacterium]|nr:alpha/beta hydrolase [Acidobacteriota bacterium]
MDFRPHPLLRGPHAQTIFGSLIPAPKLAETGEEHRVSLADGDQLSIWQHVGDQPVLVHLWHGLGGHAASSYMMRVAGALIGQGYGVLRCNHRGCGSGRGLARGLYHSGRSDDLARVLQWARDRWPNQRHLMVGFSLSGNALLLLLGRDQTALPDGALAINAPLDLADCANRLHLGLNRIYDFRFTYLCKQAVRQRIQVGYDLPKPNGIRHLKQFDAEITAPVAGFKDRAHYYETCSSGPWLPKIQTPTICLHAQDDPLIPADLWQRFKRADSVQLELAAGGGHMGYWQAGQTPLGGHRWLEYAALHHLKSLAK